MCERHVKLRGYQYIFPSCHLCLRLTAVWKLISRPSVELERRKMSGLLFLASLAGGQNQSTSIYRVEGKGEHVTDGYAGTALSDGLTPPWGCSSSCGSVTVLNRFCSGVSHCVWHWQLIGQTLCELLSRWGVSVRKMLWLHITFHLALKPRPYLCSRSGTHSALSFIYNLLHSKGLWERTRQTVPV